MRTPLHQFFPHEEFQARLDGVRTRMDERGLDALLLTTPENIYYLTGYQTPGYYYFIGLIVPLTGDPVLVPPPHEESLVASYSVVEDYRLFHDTEDPINGIAGVLEELGAASGSIGVEYESWFLKIRDYMRLRLALPEARLHDGSGVVENGRLIKSDREIGYMRDAADIAVASVRAGMDAIAVGASERDLGAAVVSAQVLAGSEYSGLPPFITSGEQHSMQVHSTWSDRVIEDGDVVFFEVPGVVNRYHSALTRGAFVGDPPDLLLRGSEVNRDALRLAKERIKPGVRASEAFEAVRQRIDDADVPYVQGRRIAYGIGTAFPPGWDEGHIFSINGNEQRVFHKGMTFHVITTMRLPSMGAIGCSDTVLVTDDGCETLTAGVANELYVV
ncbi:MAG TPA: Xaa-Pro peptidase family protein [Dehalococcoidia bacterium]|jgi:Xaa-Pro dipeptidase|nr:peptidase M24 [Chloroflexota bacterium]MDP5877421.1 Xaa-Pro peptidase family protein [Dehalococcoidia bacterium]MDP6272472.1 Xaa-Pro peptidase family protein [Dehalococcoidia bacterium]MDP7161121.1 Xaa-Pro peptidase family protein [Dehalococcoidia bacterium]MDP7213083.1 Xaa-Pro peptidase family protein [Dehalococcoidia bacterium]|tara:strand:- start:4437 stop:5600 length:1164 start_codon:yes stop_codon:yes gene_type:complete